MFKHRIHSKVLVLIILILLSQYISSQSILDSRRYEAWTIEYVPYRFLVEDAIEEYRAINKNTTTIPSVKASDKIVIVRSRTTGQIYEIRYGSTDIHTTLDQEQVKWIFGETLRKTILERDKYYNLDSKVVEKIRKNQRELDYLQNLSEWTVADILLSPQRCILKFHNDYAFKWTWGNELFGKPYVSMGSMEWGLLSRSFEIGIKTPTILNSYYTNGYLFSDFKYNILNGGWGGFARFNYQRIFGEFSFSSKRSGQKDRTIDITTNKYINFIDLSGLLYVAGEIPREVIPLRAATLVIKPGVFVYRVAHREVDNNNTLVKRDESRPGYSLDSTDTYFTGIFLRIEAVSNFTDGGFPRIETAVQLLLQEDYSILAKFVFNFNKVWGIPITIVYSNNDVNWEWEPEAAIYIGVRLLIPTM